MRRYHRWHDSSDHVWQGRFKAFPIEHDAHLLAVLRYIELNPVRVHLVARAEDWRWSSARAWGEVVCGPQVETGPVVRPESWLEWVNGAMEEMDIHRIRQSVNRNAPYGSDTWTAVTAKRLGLEASLRPSGRPRRELVQKGFDTVINP